MDSWQSLQATLDGIEADLRTAQADDDYQAVGTRCRELIISLGQAVYDSERHGRDDTSPSPNDGEELISRVLDHALAGSSAAEARGFLRKLIPLVNAVVHRRPASARDALIAVAGTRCLLESLRAIEGIGPVLGQPWAGVVTGARYFAWDGPSLHALEDRTPIPAPEPAIGAIRQAGLTPFFGTKAKLRRYLARGDLQVYETDRRTWRRELLHAPDGDQVLLVSFRGAV